MRGSSRRKKKRNLRDDMTEQWRYTVLEEDTDGMQTVEPKSKPRMTSTLGKQREVYDKVVTQHGLLEWQYGQRQKTEAVHNLQTCYAAVNRERRNKASAHS